MAIEAPRKTSATSPKQAPGSPIALYWLRRDLRLHDNPALLGALRAGTVIAVYILEDGPLRSSVPASAARWWLHHSLMALQAAFAAQGVPLLFRRGNPIQILQELAKSTKARSLHYSRLYDDYSRKRDTAVEQALQSPALDVTSYNGHLLYEPWELTTKGGTPFKVYGPFSRAAFAAPRAKPLPMPLPIPKTQTLLPLTLKTDNLVDWQLLPTHPNWAKSFSDAWKPGEVSASKALQAFVRGAVKTYDTGRNLPSQPQSSRLSPYLAFGELSPRQIWAAVTKSKQLDANRSTYLKEVLWREFAYHTLYYAPQLPDQPLDKRYAKFPFRADQKAFRAWQRGQTGYPIVDAGMRQLWQTGWMHNRVRLITASFLVKHLLLRWQDGADWFLDTLVDIDIASNSMNWQWVAGCGVDASPFFRIFNPVLQSRKFKAGDYIRTYVPELAALPERYIHAPWEAPATVLNQAKVTLGKMYPPPIVDHAAARDRALFAFRAMRERDAKVTATVTNAVLPTTPAAHPAKRASLVTAGSKARKAKPATGR